MMEICIIGSGKWGTAIYHAIQDRGYKVTLISRKNLDILKIQSFDLAFIALRSEAIEECLEEYKKFLPKQICALSKGVFTTQIPFLSTKIKDMGLKFALLYGPNFADEVESKSYTISTIASEDSNLILLIKNLLQSDFFHLEHTAEVWSIEVYGIFKNIIAIFMGFAHGIQMPQNTKSAILTKLIQEAVSLTGNTHSFLTSAGIGDLFLTASSSKSRNFSFGVEFAKNKNFIPQDTIEGLRSLNAILNIESSFNFKLNNYKILHTLFIKKEEVDFKEFFI